MRIDEIIKPLSMAAGFLKQKGLMKISQDAAKKIPDPKDKVGMRAKTETPAQLSRKAKAKSKKAYQQTLARQKGNEALGKFSMEKGK
jgi:hypothetical protein